MFLKVLPDMLTVTKHLDASVVPASRTPSSGNNNQLGLTLSINGLTLLLLVLFAVYRWPTEALTTLTSKLGFLYAARRGVETLLRIFVYFSTHRPN